MNTSPSACWHCGEALPQADAPLARVGKQTHAVCCQGCKAAAEWIDQLGLADYYRLRSEPATRAPDADTIQRDAELWQRPQLSRHVVRTLDDGWRESIFLVDGVRCSACVWLIERAIGTLDGVASVQVNAAARRARIVWREADISLADLIQAFARTGYRALPLDAAAIDDTRRRESRSALKRLLVAGFGAMQSMMYAAVLYFGGDDESAGGTRELFRWLSMLVATPVVLYSAQPFFAGALRSLRARRLGMDVPVALAIALIYAASLVEALRGGAEVYFESVSMFVFFLLVGRYLEMRARHRAGDLGDALARLTPMFADRLRADGSLERVGALELQHGDRVHVAEGSLVPADGRVTQGQGRVDEALVSGESAPIAKARGDALIAGSLLVEGPLELVVERAGEETQLAGIIALVTRAQTARPRLAEVGERMAARFVARVLTLAALTAIAWAFVDPTRAFPATLAVLVVSCPCAFALAVPAALTRALAVLARHGVLVVQPDVIERLTQVRHAVFDKTGTLTEARLDVEQIHVLRADGVTPERAREQALALAGALARGSRHPVAQAVAAAAGAHATLAVEGLQAEAGRGLRGRIEGREWRLGQPAFACAGQGVDAALEHAVVLADDEGPFAAFELSETLRTDARATIADLRDEGIHVEIVSGDSAPRVEAIARRLDINAWHARQSPADKLARLDALHVEGTPVLAIGDGINDAPVLAAADIAVSLASGTDLAQATSHLVLNGDRLGGLVSARRIARETMAILTQNQRWALAYNLSAVPIAAFGFVPPWLAALGMSLSSLVVVLNALRIGRRRTVDAHAPVAHRQAMA